MSTRIEKAERFALKHHGDKKYGDGPYILHLMAVHAVLVEFGVTDEDVLCAAYLHDTLEDTGLPVNVIAKEFGPRVLNLVWAVSGFGDNRWQRFWDTVDKVTACRDRKEAASLKTADRITNVRASVGTSLMQMYVKQASQFDFFIANHAPQNMRDALNALYPSPTS